MICKDCKDKPLARGIKDIKCYRCGEKSMTNVSFMSICEVCSDMLSICQVCSKNTRVTNEGNGFEVICLDCHSKDIERIWDEDMGEFYQCNNCGQHDRY